jgi:DNA-binding GntR family transcriptional regulator
MLLIPSLSIFLNLLDSKLEFHWYTSMSIVSHLERDRAYRLLLDLILGGKIDADTPLSERKLADMLDMGRTPVREALRNLVRDGVLEARPARGTFVCELSMEDVQEIYEVRYALEGMAAYLAAERGPTEELLVYGPKFRNMAAAPETFDPVEEYELGAEFHLEVFRSAQNRNLLQMYEPLRIRFAVALGLPQHYDHERVRQSVSEHLEILVAIEAGEGTKAQQLICNHLAEGLEARMRIFKSLHRYEAPVAPRSMVSI